jgi:hypothetical protein
VLRLKGISNMPSHNEIAEANESQGEISNEAAVTEASWIEEILNRAYEIRRARGGLFGYDLEDWLQAQKELTERNRAGGVRAKETPQAGSAQWDQERNREKCVGLNN